MALLDDAARLLVRVWDVDRWEELQSFTGHTGGIVCIALSSDGRYALSGGHDHTVRLWRLPDPAEIAPPGDRPFVVMAHDGRPERAYPTLAAAAMTADDGDTIEIRGNGPFVTPTIDCCRANIQPQNRPGTKATMQNQKLM